MFNSITIRFDNNTHTLGNIIECLLFYDEVNLIIGMNGLPVLWRAIGVDGLERLRDYGLHICAAVNTISCGEIPNLGEDIRTFILQGTDLRQRMCDNALLEFFETKHLDASQQAISNHYADMAEEFKFTQSTIDAVHEDIYNNFVHKKIIQAQLEEIGSPISMFDPANKYEFRKVSKGFVFHTNLLCGELDEQARKAGLKDICFRHNAFLMEMTEAYAAMDFAAHKNSTLCVSPAHSLILSCKQQDLIERCYNETRTMRDFERLETNTFNDLVSAVDSGERTKNEIFELLDAAQEFKQWKRDLPETADFLLEYQKAMLAQLPWVQRTSGKILRFITTSLTGLIPVAGIAVSALDAFVVEKWNAGGWKPAQFVTGNLKKFMDITEN